MPVPERPMTDKGKKAVLTLETVLVLGLTLKLILTVLFLVILAGPADMTLEPRQAFAQEDKTEAPAPDRKTPETKPPDQPDQPAKPDQPANPEQAAKPDQTPLTDEQAPPSAPDVAPTETTAPASPAPPVAAAEKRAADLDAREQQLKDKEEALKALEEHIKQTMADIEATKLKLEDLVKKQEELVAQQKVLLDARIEHLVRAYKAMRPEAAGKLVDNLDDDVAVQILSAMPSRNAGLILAAVNPEKAARLTKAISKQKKRIPVPGEEPPETQAQADQQP